MTKRVTVKIDRKHTVQLLIGQRVTIKVPTGATQLSLELEPRALDLGKHKTLNATTLGELFDIFFNRRPARA